LGPRSLEQTPNRDQQNALSSGLLADAGSHINVLLPTLKGAIRSVNELARSMDADPKHIHEWIHFSYHFLDARLLDAGFEAGIGRMLSDLRGDDQ
jgi:hypothetical protein